MYPYGTIDAQAYANEQALLQQRIAQLEQARNQQLNIYGQQQPAQQVPTCNVNWIQVAGIEGAKSQIVQPGHTAWMMDNNSPVFYVKSVDGMGSATFKAFRFAEIAPETQNATQNGQEINMREYVTREEFNALLAKLGESPTSKEETT